MIDIIIKRDNHKKHIVCPRCGSELAYAEEDTLLKNYVPSDSLYNAIECPNCKAMIKVE